MPVSSAVYEHSFSAPIGPLITSNQSGHVRDLNHPIDPQAYGPSGPPQYGIFARPDELRQIDQRSQRRRRASSPTPVLVEIEPRGYQKSYDTSVRSAVAEERSSKDERGAKKQSRAAEDESEGLDREKRRLRKTSSKDSDEKRRREQEIDERIEELRSQERREKRREERRGDRRAERTDDTVEAPKSSDRRSSNKDFKSSSWGAPVLAGGVGAVVAETIARRSKQDSDGRRDEREATSDPESEQQQQRARQEAKIARKAAAAIKRAPSPAHEDYSSFFDPTEFLSKSDYKEPTTDVNADVDITTFNAPEITTTEPSSTRGMSKNEQFAGLDGDDTAADPNYMLPWRVPRLNLIKPTPVPSRAGSTIGDASPRIMPQDQDEPDRVQDVEATGRERGRVTFGDTETREYEVITPDQQRDQFVDAKEDHESRASAEGSSSTRDEGDPYFESPVEEVPHMPGQFDDDIDFAATVAAATEATGFDPNIVIDDPNFRRRESPPGSNGRPDRQSSTGIVTQMAHQDDRSSQRTSRRDIEDDEASRVPQTSAKPSMESFSDVVDASHSVSPRAKPSKSTSAVSESFGDVVLDAKNRSTSPQYVEIVPKTTGKSMAAFGFGNVVGSALSMMQSKSGSDGGNGNDNKELEQEELNDPLDGREEADERKAFKREKKSKRKSNGADVSTADRDSPPAASSDIFGEDGYVAPVTATGPLPDEFEFTKKTKKKSKRKSNGFDDDISTTSSPATFGDPANVNGKNMKKSETKAERSVVIEEPEEADEQASPYAREAPEEATVDDFQESKKKSKKSKDRKSTLEDGSSSSRAPTSADDPRNEDDDQESRTSRKSNGKKGKRRSQTGTPGYEELGRETQDQPAKVHPWTTFMV